MAKKWFSPLQTEVAEKITKKYGEDSFRCNWQVVTKGRVLEQYTTTDYSAMILVNYVKRSRPIYLVFEMKLIMPKQ